MLTSDKDPQEGPLGDPSTVARLLLACPDALMLVDERRNIQYANSAAVQVTGYDYDELIGLNVAELVPAEMQQWLEETAEKVNQIAKVSCVAGKTRRQDGTVVPVEVSISKVATDEGPIYMIIGRETAHLVHLSEEALHAEHLRALGEIAMGIAHDFRNLLAAILGRSQLLLMKTADPQMCEALETIEKAALDGAETVNRIMRCGRPAQGEPEFVPLDLNQILGEVIDNTRSRWLHQPQREGKCIDLETHLTALPPTEGNAAGLRQFFTNLIMNACDAMPDGGRITVSTRPGPTSATVTISDTGSGMTPEVRERIFDSFFTTKKSGSLGLGLALGKDLVHRHGGEITVDSSAGEGTAFTVTLPRSEQVVAEIPSEPSLPPATTQSARILVVDDESVLCELLRETVVSLGHEVNMASCGEEALQLLNLQRYDVVITDLGMPGIPGSRVAQAAKQASPDTHVVLLTGWDNPLSPVQNKYVDQILIKPVSVADLGAAIEAGVAA